jgi:hypothetical protein
MAAPAPEFKMPSSGVPGADKELQAAFKQQEDAETGRASLAGQQAKELGALLQQQQQAKLDANKIWQDRWEANQKQSDQVAQDIAASRIDPEHYWQDHSRAVAGLALILGGIGSGLTHGPNQALEMLNRNVDADIQAQTANLGVKKTLLSHYMEQGHNLQEASRLAKADLLDVQRGEMSMMANKSAGDIANLAAQDATGKLRAQAVNERQTGYTRTMQNKLMALEMQEKAMALKYAPQMQAIKFKAESGERMPNEARVFMDPERTVNVPGGVAYAQTKKDADALRETEQAMRSGHAAAQRYRALADTVGLGGTDYDQGTLAVQDMLNAYQSVLGRSNAPRGEQEKALDSALKNPTSMLHSKEAIEDMANQFEAMMRKHAASAYGARLVNASAASGAH